MRRGQITARNWHRCFPRRISRLCCMRYSGKYLCQQEEREERGKGEAWQMEREKEKTPLRSLVSLCLSSAGRLVNALARQVRAPLDFFMWPTPLYVCFLCFSDMTLLQLCSSPIFPPLLYFSCSVPSVLLGFSLSIPPLVIGLHHAYGFLRSATLSLIQRFVTRLMPHVATCRSSSHHGQRRPHPSSSVSAIRPI